MGASPARRVGLVAALLGGVGAMPWIGFPAAGALVFLITMAVAMYDPWTPRRGIIYPLVGLAIVAAFYLLFSKILLVPLPSGSWFD